MAISGKEINGILESLQQATREKNRNEIDLACKSLLHYLLHPLQKIARAHLLYSADTRDLVIQSITRAYQYIESYKPGENGFSWLCKIVENMAHAFNKEHFSHVSLEGMELLLGKKDSRLETLHIKLDIEKALSKLKADKRDYFIAHFVYGLTEDEIAAKYHRSKSTISYHLQDSVEKMREYLKHYRTKD